MVAFVTFYKKSYRDAFLKAYKGKETSDKYQPYSDNFKIFKAYEISSVSEKGPDPEDVLWSNLHKTDRHR